VVGTRGITHGKDVDQMPDKIGQDPLGDFFKPGFIAKNK
jgi:hypothetical protein